MPTAELLALSDSAAGGRTGACAMNCQGGASSDSRTFLEILSVWGFLRGRPGENF